MIVCGHYPKGKPSREQDRETIDFPRRERLKGIVKEGGERRGEKNKHPSQAAMGRRNRYIGSDQAIASNRVLGSRGSQSIKSEGKTPALGSAQKAGPSSSETMAIIGARGGGRKSGSPIQERHMEDSQESLAQDGGGSCLRPSASPVFALI